MINKNIIPYIIILILLIIIFLQRSCSSQKGINKTQATIKYDTVFMPPEIKTKDTIIYKTIKGEVIKIPGRVDTIKIKEFEKATDFTKTELFTEATRIRQYNQEFNDSLADISIFAETRGELLKIAPTVTIKARLPAKETKFAVYGGIEVYNNLNFNNGGAKVNLFFQNKKGDLFTGAYDTNKNIYLGYSLGS